MFRWAKNIIVCCDGTGNEYGTHNTNVLRTYQLAVNNNRQLVYYDPGVGTGGWMYSKSLRQTSWDTITGAGLQKNIENSYRFLMKTYRPGDRIFLFGFSRGAFTVRALAGMLSRCGLLGSNLDNLVEYASKIYNEEGDDLEAGFKETFARDCPVHFIGVWDTVAALASDEGDKSHDYTLNPEIRNAYHAVALDETREKFKPCLWDHKKSAPGQTMEQVWFAGVHADVGGGYGGHSERELSDIALRWMLGKAAKCGMKIKKEYAQVKGNPLGQLHESRKGAWKALGTYERGIPPGSKVHQSVQHRIQNNDEYEPIVQLPDDVEWVDPHYPYKLQAGQTITQNKAG